jgi:hypothetical protein
MIFSMFVCKGQMMPHACTAVKIPCRRSAFNGYGPWIKMAGELRRDSVFSLKYYEKITTAKKWKTFFYVFVSLPQMACGVYETHVC